VADRESPVVAPRRLARAALFVFPAAAVVGVLGGVWPAVALLFGAALFQGNVWALAWIVARLLAAEGGLSPLPLLLLVGKLGANLAVVYLAILVFDLSGAYFALGVGLASAALVSCFAI
jgi:hypothetical protein